ncbi:transposase [archaeon]|nr:transposase [archaeon]
MIKRTTYTEDFKRKIGFELASGLTSAAEISKRERISSTTLYKWRDAAMNIEITADEKEVMEMRKRLKELEEIVSDQVLTIHILKKTQKIMEQLKRQERSSGSISPHILESKKAVKR